MSNWWVFQGNRQPHDGIGKLPLPPRWRHFKGTSQREALFEEPDEQVIQRGAIFQPGQKEIELVNAALYLRRPLLITGKPGTGKSSLAYAVAYELKLGPVLLWPITSRSILQDGLYKYDAIGRLQEANLHHATNNGAGPDIGKFIQLGPLGTALLPSKYPRVLLIDEIDKSDIDLPNDLLNTFEDGQFEIPELARIASDEPINVRPHDGSDPVAITRGRVICQAFPFVVLTSNGEKELPAPLLRRCLRLDISVPSAEKLAEIVESHFGETDTEATLNARQKLVKAFVNRRERGDLATDQLLNAIYLSGLGIDLNSSATDNKDGLIEAILRHLTT
ncbi:MAG: MoxR family ATPase [Anaerolineales bacterium]|nr:MoxR family ATPase [Anaerolineales bacterium]